MAWTDGVGSNTSFPALRGPHSLPMTSFSADRLSLGVAQTAKVPVTVVLVLVLVSPLRVSAWPETLERVHVRSSIADVGSQPAGAGQ